VLPGALELAAEFLPCGGRANARHFTGVTVEKDVVPERHLLCLDPQTSGGLLLVVDPASAAAAASYLVNSAAGGWVVGHVEAPGPAGAAAVRVL
jgi:selenophosphate synthase